MLSRFCTRGLQRSATPLIARAFYANGEDISVEYADKQYDLQFKDTDGLQKRFLNGLHPKVVQSKAFDRASISSLRMGLASQVEGQHPALANLIAQANQVDTTLESVLTQAGEEDPVYNATRHFEFGTYRRGDEDSVINMKIDWPFFREVFPDKNFIDTLRTNYEETIEEVFQDTKTEDPIPDELAVFSRFFAQLVRYLAFLLFHDHLKR